MSATGAYAVGLYAVTLLLTALLHAVRARITLAPLFALGAIETFLMWQLAQIGWWGEWGAAKFNAPVLALLPAILLAAGLIYALDGTRTARSYTLTLAAAALASIGHEEFVRSLGNHMPMPSFFFNSLAQQIDLAFALVLAAVAVAIGYEVSRKAVASAGALALSMALGGLTFLLAFSLLTYGVAIGWRNIQLESGHYAIGLLPVLLLALAYGAVATRRNMFLPARRMSEVFALWRASDHAYDQVRQGFLQARETISELTALNDRLTMERQLREYQMQHSPLALIDLDAAGRILRVNPAAQTLLAEVRRGGAIDAVLPGFTAFLARGVSLSEVFESGDGGMRQIQATVMPIRLQQRIDGFSVIAEDVTLRERAKFKAQVAERVKGIQMTSKVIGHDFANMMLAIEGNLAQMRAVLPPALAQTLDGSLTAIANAASRGRDMLKQLGTQQPFHLPDLKTQELWPLVAEAVRLQLAGALAAGIQLRPDIQSGIFVDIDTTQILRVLINLIGNAVRATPVGGTITVGLRREAGGAVITVNDTGRGMTAEQVAVAFEPGFSTKSGGQGGLGLAISYLIIDAHGGRLTLASNAGHGTTATVWLPIADPARAEARNLSLLVAMADDRRREALVAALSPMAGELTEVADGDELDAVLAEDPRPWAVAVVDSGIALSSAARDVIAAVCRISVHSDDELELVWANSCAAQAAQELLVEVRLTLARIGSTPDIPSAPWRSEADAVNSGNR